MSLYHQLSSDHLSTRHEGHGADEACHDIITLLPDVFLCIDSWGRKHTVELDVEFFDEAGEPVGYPVWIRIWTPILDKRRSNAHWAGRGNLAIATRSIGLGVSVIATGTVDKRRPSTRSIGISAGGSATIRAARIGKSPNCMMVSN